MPQRPGVGKGVCYSGKGRWKVEKPVIIPNTHALRCQACTLNSPVLLENLPSSTDARATSRAGISHPTGWAKVVGKESQLHMPFPTFLRGTTAGSEQERDGQAQGSSTEKAELPDARGKVRSDPACRR